MCGWLFQGDASFGTDFTGGGRQLLQKEAARRCPRKIRSLYLKSYHGDESKKVHSEELDDGNGNGATGEPENDGMNVVAERETDLDDSLHDPDFSPGSMSDESVSSSESVIVLRKIYALLL